METAAALALLKRDSSCRESSSHAAGTRFFFCFFLFMHTDYVYSGARSELYLVHADALVRVRHPLRSYRVSFLVARDSSLLKIGCYYVVHAHRINVAIVGERGRFRASRDFATSEGLHRTLLYVVPFDLVVYYKKGIRRNRRLVVVLLSIHY